MSKLLRTFAGAGLLIFATSCSTKTVVIDSRADVVRLGPDVRGTVYIQQAGEWVKVGKTKLPEGWYAGPMPAE